jgi:hypothetical protein
MRTVKLFEVMQSLRIGALAGAAGGLAEVAWVLLYGWVTDTPVAEVARGVVLSLIPAAATSSGSIWFGIFIHMVLALALGLALGLALQARLLRIDMFEAGFLFMVPALAIVWAVNFLLVLPYLNPRFVDLLPYSVTLFSKLLFGLSAAVVFRADRVRRVRISRR